jgi:hypothetical protein
MSCGLRTTAKITEDGKRRQALVRGKDCPVCKRKVKVGLRPAAETYSTLEEAKSGHRAQSKPRYGEGGHYVIPRGEGRTPGLEPTDIDPFA